MPATTPLRRLLAVLLVVLVLLAGCGGDAEPAARESGAGQPPAEPVTMRLAWSTVGQEVFYVMQQFPEVAPNLGTWYEIEWNQLGSGESGQAIAGGAVDGGTVSSLAAANALAQGVELVITGQLIEERAPNTPMTWLVRADSGITSPADLAGQPVGTNGAGTSADYIAEYYLRTQGGLEPQVDYQKIDVNFPVMADALLAGQIATGPFPPPFLQQAMATGQVRPLFDVLDIQPEIVALLNVFRREFVEENRTAVEKFVEDWAVVFQWMADPANRDQVIQANHEATEIPVEVLERYLLTEEDGFRTTNGAINMDALQSNWDFFREQGAFEPELRVADYVIDDLQPPLD